MYFQRNQNLPPIFIAVLILDFVVATCFVKYVIMQFKLLNLLVYFSDSKC